jgi:hypothetical protein
MTKFLLFLIIGLSGFLTNSYAVPNYDAALAKAQEAAYIQSGLKNFENQFTKYMENESKKYVRKAKVEKELAVILFGYRFYKNPSYTFNFRKGRSLSLNTNSLSYSFPIEDFICVITKR